jgi:hypothetical protein
MSTIAFIPTLNDINMVQADHKVVASVGGYDTPPRTSPDVFLANGSGGFGGNGMITMWSTSRVGVARKLARFVGEQVVLPAVILLAAQEYIEDPEKPDTLPEMVATIEGLGVRVEVVECWAEGFAGVIYELATPDPNTLTIEVLS